MKTRSIFAFLSDSILIIAFVFVAIAAFLGTYALSPVVFEKSSLAQDSNSAPVLGEFDVKYLEYEDLYEEHESFTVESSALQGDYKADMKIGPISAGRIEKNIVRVVNSSVARKSASIRIKYPLLEAEGIDVFLKVEGEEYEFPANDDKQIGIDLGKGDSIEIALVMESDKQINYPVSIELTITSE